MSPAQSNGRQDTRGTYTNQAGDQSNVGMQAGVVIGDVHLYQTSDDAAPREKYRVALNCLGGNMPRRAEELILDAIDAGFTCDLESGITSCHVAYHWALAVLSGRSFDHLSPENFGSIQRASNLALQDDRDAWWKPASVVFQLISCLIRQEKTGGADPDAFGAVLFEYESLQIERRDEVRCHLDMILTGGIQDQLDAIFAKEVRDRRMDGERTKRVPKFFQPDPEPPRERRTLVPELTVTGRAIGAIGAIMTTVALVWAFILIGAQHWIAVAVIVLALLGGAYLTIRFGTPYLAVHGRKADRERERGGYAGPGRYSMAVAEPLPSLPAEPDHDETDEGKEVRARRRQFRRQLKPYIRDSFEKEAPGASGERSRWENDTRRVESALNARLLGLYDEPPTEPGGVNWLVDWYAQEARRKWDAGQLGDDGEDPTVEAPSGYLLAGGVSACAAGLVALFVELFSASIGIPLAILALGAVGGTLLATSRIDVYVVQRHRLPIEKADIEQRLNVERKEFDRCAQELANRPRDAEMARWLEYDKIYMKNLALNQYGLTNRDIVAHAVLAESGYGRRRARIINGPWRYSRYIVSLYLLTAAGMRRVTANLDFETGIVSNQRRYNFRFDAIAAITVTELGIRFDDGRREVILLDEHDPTQDQDVRSLILAQGFRLSLASGENITAVVENFDDGLLDRMREDPDRLYELAFDTSGVAAALRVLEAVAAEGREWIHQERARRSRRILDFQRSIGAFGVLTEAPPREPEDVGAITDSGAPHHYLIVMWEIPAPSGDADASILHDQFVSYQNTSVEPPTPQILRCLDALITRWPCVNHHGAQSSSSVSIVYNAVGPVLSCSLARSVMTEVLPICVHLAREHGLVCYDPQKQKLLLASQ